MNKSIMRLYNSVVGSKKVKKELVIGSISSVIIRVIGLFLSLLSGVLIARYLGAEQYGFYAYVFALVSLFSLPGQFGMPQLVMRETAKYMVNEQWEAMRGLWIWSIVFTIFMTVLVALVAVLAVLFKSKDFSSSQIDTMYLGVLLIPLMTLGALQGAALRGLRKIVKSQIVDAILRPFMLIILISMICFMNIRLYASNVMFLNVISGFISIILGTWFLWKAIPAGLYSNSKIVINGWSWIKSSLPLALTSALQIVNQNTDIIMIGLYRSASDVGIYRVAVQGASVVVFGLSSLNILIAPYLVQYYEKKEKQLLQKLIQKSAQVIMVITMPIVIIILIFGKQIIGKFFGQEYIDAYMPLCIICIGQLINAVFGSVGLILNMTGHEKETMKGVLIATLTNVILNTMLIPSYGIDGAALASAITLFVWNVILWLVVMKKLDVDTMAFPLFKKMNIGNNY